MPEWLIPTILIAGTIIAMWTALGKRTSRVETRLEDRMGRVEKRLMNAFYQVFGKLDIGPLSRRSPLRLNDLGKAVSSETRAPEWVARVLDSLTEWVKEKDSYEIQEHCFGFAERFDYTAEEQHLIRESAFKHGLPTEQVCRVLAIELRDRLLKHAGLEAPE